MSLAYVVLAIIWLALIVYAAFGGADFGAGVWNLLAVGKTQQRQQELIDSALGPVWEANHVWLVFLVVGLFTAFPGAFADICIVLFIPIVLALLGVVLRGSAFVFRTHGLLAGHPSLWIWNRVFSFSSTITPFFLGTAAAAVASGRIQTQGTVQSDLGSIWLSPFALVIGVMAVALCASIGAVFLTVEASNSKEYELVRLYRIRAIIAGAVTAVLGAVGLLISPSQAPVLWNGMLSHALPLVIATMVIGLGTAAALFLRYFRIARILIIVETAFLLGTWGVSQIPYLIPPHLTVNQAASSQVMLQFLLVGIIVGMALMLPSLWFLFYIFKFKNTGTFIQRGSDRADGNQPQQPQGIVQSAVIHPERR